MKRIKAILLLAVLVTLPWAISPAAAQASIDGRKFNTEAGFVGKPAHVKEDIISFSGGKLHSSDCDQYGYNKGDYRATSQGDAVAFEAETVSEEYGRNVWSGVIKGDVIEGTMIFHRKPTWWRSNPEPLVHWFRGKLVQ